MTTLPMSFSRSLVSVILKKSLMAAAIQIFNDSDIQNYMPVVLYGCETWSLGNRDVEKTT